LHCIAHYVAREALTFIEAVFSNDSFSDAIPRVRERVVFIYPPNEEFEMSTRADLYQAILASTVPTHDPLSVQLGMGAVFRTEHWRRSKAGECLPSCHGLAVQTATAVSVSSQEQSGDR